jgi:hypothetical protein
LEEARSDRTKWRRRGIDIRGIEAIATEPAPADQESGEEESEIAADESVSVLEERVWSSSANGRRALARRRQWLRKPESEPRDLILRRLPAIRCTDEGGHTSMGMAMCVPLSP